MTLSILPTHQWLMNDNPITSLADTTDGTAINLTATSGTGQASVTGLSTGFGGGLAFDNNGTGGFSSASAQTSLTPAGSWSWAVWVKPNTDDWSHIFGMWLLPGLRSTALYLLGNQQAVTAGYVQFVFAMSTDGGSGGQQTVTSGEYAINNWYHVACTYDGSNMKMYVNNSLLTPVAKTGNVFSAGTTFNVGHSGAGSPTYPDVTIDALYFFPGALTADDVSQLYANGNPATEDVIAASGVISEVPQSHTDSGSSTIGELATSLDNNVAKYTHPDGYDFYVRDGAAGREGYSKAGQNVKIVDVVYNANSDAGQKYVASSTPLNTLLRLNGENPSLMYEVTGSEETIATAYMKLSDGTLQSIGKAKAKEITLVNQSDVSYPLVLPLVAP